MLVICDPLIAQGLAVMIKNLLESCDLSKRVRFKDVTQKLKDNEDFFSQVSCIVSSGVHGTTSVFLKPRVGMQVCVYMYI